MQFVSITIGGRHLRLHGEGAQARLRADGRCVDVDTTFERVELGHDRIALRTLDDRFMAVRRDRHAGHTLVLQPDLTPAAAFEEVLWPSGQVSLRSCELTYVGVRMGAGAVTVHRTEPAVTERFVFVPVAAAMVPRQRVAPRPASDRPTAGTAL